MLESYKLPPKKAVELTIPHPAVKLACSSTDDGGGGVYLRQTVGDKAEHYRYPSACFVVYRCTGKVSEARVTGSESLHGYAAGNPSLTCGLMIHEMRVTRQVGQQRRALSAFGPLSTSCLNVSCSL